MASSTERLGAAVVLAAVASGCFSGHLLDAARRREHVLRVQEAYVGDDALVLRYAAVDANDAGRPVARREQWAAIPLADVRAAGRPVDTLDVTWLDAASARRRAGRPVAIVRTPDAGAPSLEAVTSDGRDVALILHESPDAAPSPPLDTRAFTRIHVQPWVWPLLPFTFAVDSVGTPALLLFAPAVISLGD
jgi:hypothetical protein